MQCCNAIADAETIGGILLENIPPTNLTTTNLDNFWEQMKLDKIESIQKPVMQSSDIMLPSVLKPYVGDSLDEIKWRSLVPGIRHYPLGKNDKGNGSVRLLSITPGITIPQHTHKGSEMALVIRGAYKDKIGHFKTGDVADLDESSHHQPIVDAKEPCVCLMATDKKIQLTGFFNRMLQPFVGI